MRTAIAVMDLFHGQEMHERMASVAGRFGGAFVPLAAQFLKLLTEWPLDDLVKLVNSEIRGSASIGTCRYTVRYELSLESRRLLAFRSSRAAEPLLEPLLRPLLAILARELAGQFPA